MTALFQALLFFISATLSLRLLGKRTVAQMSIAEVIVAFALGTVLVHPLKSKEPWSAVYHGALIVAGALAINLIQIYFPRSIAWLSGEPTLLIKDGKILIRNVTRSRMTEDHLKMRLRLANVTEISHVKTATLESNGELGLQLIESERGATKADVDEIKKRLDQITAYLQLPPVPSAERPKSETDLFRQAERLERKDPFP